MTGKSPDVHLTGTTTINGGFLAGNVKLAKWYPSSNHLSTVYLRIYLAIYTNYLSSCPASLCTNLMQIGHPHAHMQIQCIYAPIYIYTGMAIQRCRKIVRDLGIFQAAAIFSVLHMRHPFAPRPQPPGSGKYEVQNGAGFNFLHNDMDTRSMRS